MVKKSILTTLQPDANHANCGASDILAQMVSSAKLVLMGLDHFRTTIAQVARNVRSAPPAAAVSAKSANTDSPVPLAAVARNVPRGILASMDSATYVKMEDSPLSPHAGPVLPVRLVKMEAVIDVKRLLLQTLLLYAVILRCVGYKNVNYLGFAMTQRKLRLQRPVRMAAAPA